VDREQFLGGGSEVFPRRGAQGPAIVITPERLKTALCAEFCAAFEVHPVASGYAVSSIFTDRSGDPISLYVVAEDDGYRLEDDGEYLSRLVASGIEIERGQRGQLLDAILGGERAYWDRDTFEIRTDVFAEAELVKRAGSFLSALIRARDLELLTREFVRSTFREDAIRAIVERFGRVANIDQDVAVHRDFSDFPSDAVVRPKRTGKVGAIYFVNTNEKLGEALLLHQEAKLKARTDFSVIALIEEPNMGMISRRKFQRAQNRDLTMPIFRGDENAALDQIERKLEIKRSAA
jgi:hypothetical protein